MPNHCENDLWISGNSERVNELLAFIGAVGDKPDFNFGAILPYPPRFVEQDASARAVRSFGNGGGHFVDRGNDEALQALAVHVAKYGTEHDGFNAGGYEWCLENWGTKWGAYSVTRRDYSGGVCLTFQTAWSPPKRELIEALADKFDDVELSLEYFERGMGFSGGMRWVEKAEAEGRGGRFREWSSKGYLGTRGG